MYTETKMVSMDLRSSVLKNREALKAQYGVTIFFPRDSSKMFNGFQPMVMEGSMNSIAQVKVRVDKILAEAQTEFTAYKIRQKRRRNKNRYMDTKAQVTVKIAPKKKNVNPFAALMETDDEQEIKEEFPQLVCHVQKKIEWGVGMNTEESDDEDEEESKQPIGAWGDCESDEE